MATFIRLTIAASLLCSVGYFLNWDEPLRLTFALPVALVSGALIFWVAWMARPSQEEIEDGLNVFRELMLGIVFGVVWSGITAVALHVALRHPETLKLLDSDRQQVEEVLRVYETNNNWTEAASYLEKAITAPHSPDFTQWLVEQALVNYVRAAAAAPENAEKYLRRACELAEEHNLPSDIYRSYLNSLRIQARVSQTNADFTRRLTAETNAREAAENAAKAREAKILAESKDRVRGAHAVRLEYAAAVLQQAMAPNADSARTIAVREITAADALGISTEAANRHLQAFDDYIALNSPQVFPSSMQISLRRVVPTATERTLIADLLVDAQHEALVKGIRRTDFAIRQPGRKLEHFMPVLHSDGRRLSVAVIFDGSISMQGTPLVAARNGLKQLLGQLPAGTPVWLGRFSDTTTTLVDWSADPRQAIAACDQIQAQGYTALFDAIHVGLAALRRRDGDELVLVVFSDGANTKPGPAPDDLVAVARRGGVRIHSIALQSGQVDEQLLNRMASETGGKSTVVTEANQLGQQFRQLAKDLSTPCLRIIALDYDAAMPCTISLGTGPAKTLTIPPQIETQTAKRN